MAAIIVLIAAAWHPTAHTDGGASVYKKTAASAPDETPETIQAYTKRILRALSDQHTNKWVRYWQARAACQAVPDAHAAAPIDRVLLTLTAALCAQLDDRLGVNPAAYSPRGEERGAGLLVNENRTRRGGKRLMYDVRTIAACVSMLNVRWLIQLSPVVQHG